MKNLNRVLILLILPLYFISFSCSAKKIDIRTVGEKKKNLIVGVSISEELNNYQTKYVYGTLKTNFYVGKQLHDYIFKALSAGFKVKEIEKAATPGICDVVVRLSLVEEKSGHMSFAWVDEEISVNRFNLAVAVEIYDGQTFVLKKRKTIQSIAGYHEDFKTSFSPDEVDDARLPSRRQPPPLVAAFWSSNCKKAIDKVVKELTEKVTQVVAETILRSF